MIARCGTITCMRKHSFIPWLWRGPLLSLMLFEFLALAGVLHIPVDYTVLGLFISSTAALLFFELIYDSFLKKRQHRLHWWAVVPPVLMILLDAGGDFLHFYSRYHPYDVFLHYFGPLAATLFLYDVYRALYPKAGRVMMSLFAATSAITFSVLYEIEEYLEDWYFDSNRFGDKWDTGNDLLMDFLGAMTVVLVIAITRLFFKKKAQQARNQR